MGIVDIHEINETCRRNSLTNSYQQLVHPAQIPITNNNKSFIIQLE